MDSIINKCTFLYKNINNVNGVETSISKCEGDSVYRIVRRSVRWNSSLLMDIEYISESKAVERGFDIGYSCDKNTKIQSE